MKIGDVMVPVTGDYLFCGSGIYSHAILVSIDPFVMVSEEGDMIWYSAKRDNYRALCQAHPSIIKVAMERFKRG